MRKPLGRATVKTMSQLRPQGGIGTIMPPCRATVQTPSARECVHPTLLHNGQGDVPVTSARRHRHDHVLMPLCRTTAKATSRSRLQDGIGMIMCQCGPAALLSRRCPSSDRKAAEHMQARCVAPLPRRRPEHDREAA